MNKKSVVFFCIVLCLFVVMHNNNVSAQPVAPLNERAYVLQTPTGSINGKLLSPMEDKVYPVVLLIAGSGPTDMDGNSLNMGLNTNYLKYLAESLAAKGIASVRFDKRGISTSASAGKEESNLRFDDYINDVRLWIDKLKADKRFSNVYVLGHSEGSLIGMIACKENPKVKGFISVAGAGRPMYELIESQLAAQPDAIRKMVAEINDSLKIGKIYPNVPLGLQALFRLSVQPYLISCYKYNPQQIIGTLKIPVMIVQGKTDIQVSTNDAELLKKADPEANLYLIDNMNHILKTCSTTEQQSQLATYSNPSLPVNAYLLLILEKFVKNP